MENFELNRSTYQYYFFCFSIVKWYYLTNFYSTLIFKLRPVFSWKNHFPPVATSFKITYTIISDLHLNIHLLKLFWQCFELICLPQEGLNCSDGELKSWQLSSRFSCLFLTSFFSWCDKFVLTRSNRYKVNFNQFFSCQVFIWKKFSQT